MAKKKLVEAKKPWGWHVAIHVYGSGDAPANKLIFQAAQQASDILGADDFVGVSKNSVREKPHEQVAS